MPRRVLSQLDAWHDVPSLLVGILDEFIIHLVLPCVIGTVALVIGLSIEILVSTNR